MSLRRIGTLSNRWGPGTHARISKKPWHTSNTFRSSQRRTKAKVTCTQSFINRRRRFSNCIPYKLLNSRGKCLHAWTSTSPSNRWWQWGLKLQLWPLPRLMWSLPRKWMCFLISCRCRRNLVMRTVSTATNVNCCIPRVQPRWSTFNFTPSNKRRFINTWGRRWCPNRAKTIICFLSRFHVKQIRYLPHIFQIILL